MQGQTPSIKVLDCVPLDHGGTVRALLRVRVGGIIFNHCRLTFSTPNALPVVSPPMNRWRDENGIRRYQILCEWPAPVRKAVAEAALHAYYQQAGTETEDKTR